MALISRNGKGRGNAGVSGNGEVETGRLFSGKRLYFISSTALGLFFEIRLDSTRANRDREFLQAWRAGQDKRDSKRGIRASREAEESLCRVD